MANILVKLDLMGEAVEGEILSKSSNISTNNVSNALTEPTERNYGFNGICIDKWKIGDDGSLNTFQGYNGYMFGATDENGELETDLAFTIVGGNITNVTFYFDETAQQWATEAYIDGKKMVSDDHIWTFAWDTPVSAKTITFTKWHRPNYNACITHLDIILDELIFGDKWIDDFDSLSQSVADNTVPNYGVLANTGNLTLNDVNGELKDYAEDGILKNSNYPLMIFANGKQIQYHISTDTEYDFDAMQLKIDLSNSLNNLQYENFNGISAKFGEYVDSGNNLKISAYDILCNVFASDYMKSPNLLDFRNIDSIFSFDFDGEKISTTINNQQWLSLFDNEIVDPFSSITQRTLDNIIKLEKNKDYVFLAEDTLNVAIALFDENGNWETFLFDETGQESNINISFNSNNSMYLDILTNSNQANSYLNKPMLVTADKYYNNIPYSKYGENIFILENEMNKIDNNFNFRRMFTNYIPIGIETKFLTTIDHYLKSIKIPYVLLENLSKKEIINYICDIAQLNLIERDNGYKEFISARPLFFKDFSLYYPDLGGPLSWAYKDTIIVIPLSTQTSSFYPNIISKNKYDKVLVKNKKAILNVETIGEIYCVGYERNVEGTYVPALTKNNFDYTTSHKSTSTEDCSFIEFDMNIKINKNIIKSIKDSETIFLQELINNSYIESLQRISYVDGLQKRHDEEIANKLTFDTPKDKIMYVKDKNHFNSLLQDKNYYNLIAINKSLSDDDNLYIHFRILYEISITVGTIEMQIISKKIFINAKSLSFEDVENIYGEGNILYSINGNNLLQENTEIVASEINPNIINNYSLSSYLANTILNDYKDGIINAKLTVICGDYYDIDGNKVIDWKKGEVLQVGDIVRVDKDNEGTTASRYKDGSPRYFRITGRNFRYDGVPLIDLELMEVKAIS